MQIKINSNTNTLNGQNLIRNMRLVEGKSDHPNLSVCSSSFSWKLPKCCNWQRPQQICNFNRITGSELSFHITIKIKGDTPNIFKTEDKYDKLGLQIRYKILNYMK